MTAAEQYALGYRDGRDFRQNWAYRDTEVMKSSIERILHDLQHGMENRLRAYWIGYLSALEGRPALFTETPKTTIDEELCFRADQGDSEAAEMLSRLYGPFWRSTLYDRARHESEAAEAFAIQQAQDDDELRAFLKDAVFPSARRILENRLGCRADWWSLYWSEGGAELTLYQKTEGPQEMRDIKEAIDVIGGDRPAKLNPGTVKWLMKQTAEERGRLIVAIS